MSEEMTEEQRKNHLYLGDGVYAEMTPHDLILRTGDHREHLAEMQIHIEHRLMIKLLEWMKTFMVNIYD